MTSRGSPSSTVGGMTRVRAVALLALACALAVVASSSGAFLVDDVDAPPFRVRRRPTVELGERQRPRTALQHLAGVADTLVQVVLLMVLVALLAYAAYCTIRAIVRLVGLLRDRPGGMTPTVEYDRGEESHEDADSAMRRRVADELRLLSADLDDTPDPREAVIACYVRMEAALAGAGSPRVATETPLELLARVLDSFDVPEPDVRRLTDLFTEARFSHHPVTEEMRAAARRSLAAVADALGARA